MLLRQLFDRESSTYTYLLADKPHGQACLIDPVQEQMPGYLTLLEQLDLELAFACDTHIHADHITALGALKRETGCTTYVGAPGEVDCASSGLQHGDRLAFGNTELKAIFTPGHTDSSFCFLLNSGAKTFLFSGDTLLIRGCGRTDFQNGSAQQMYHSLHDILLTLDDSTVVYPAHDYKGWTVSSIGEERAFNPRLQIASCEAFVEHMQNLDLPDPKMMDIAVPRNMSCGKAETKQ